MTNKEFWDQAYLALLNQHNPQKSKIFADQALAMREESMSGEHLKTPQTANDGDIASGYIGQIIYFERAEKAGTRRPVMARIALNAAGLGDDYPLLISELLAGLGWTDYHETLTFLTLKASVKIEWNPSHLHQLKRWAAECQS